METQCFPSLKIVTHNNHDFAHAGDEQRGILHCGSRSPDSGGFWIFMSICVHFGFNRNTAQRTIVALVRFDR